MKITKHLAATAIFFLPCLAQASDGGIPIPLSAALPEALGGTLPVEIGGIAAVSAVALLIGAQIIKRKK